MRIAFLFLALVGFSLGYVPWMQNQEYVYGIYSRTLTALPDLKEQYVGVITKGELVLQVLTPTRIVGKLVNYMYAHYHDLLEHGIDTQIPDNMLTYKVSDLNEKPFVMEIENGFIRTVFVDQAWKNDQVNQLKGILSQLQIDVNGKYLIRSHQNQLPMTEGKPYGLFKIMEPTVTGACETVYDVKPVQEYQMRQIIPRWTFYQYKGRVPQQMYQEYPETQQWQMKYNPYQGQQGPYLHSSEEMTGEQTKLPKVYQLPQAFQKMMYNVEQQKQYMTGPQQYSPESFEYDQQVQEGNFFEIVKTINYNNCMHRKGYHYGINGENLLNVYGNKVGNFLSKSAITKMIAYGTWNNFVIYDAITTNRIAVSPDLYQSQKAEVVSQIHLKLLRQQKVQVPFKEPVQMLNVGDLVYTYNLPSDVTNQVRPINEQQYQQYQQQFQQGYLEQGYEQKYYDSQEKGEQQQYGNNPQYWKNWQTWHGYLQKPSLKYAPEIPLYHYTIGYKGRGIQVDDKIKLEYEVRKLINEIAQDVLVQDEIPQRNTLEKFDILVDLVRLMSQSQMLSMYKQIKMSVTSETEQNMVNLFERKVFRDAVAHAGTGPSVFVVCQWIINYEVKGIEARDLIQDTCKYVQTPTDEVIRTIFDLLRNSEIRKHKQLYTYVLLSFTNLLRHAAVNRVSEHNRFPVYVYGEFHRQLKGIVVGEVIPYLAERLRECVTAKEDQYTLLYLRALGNIGHKEILNVYEQLLEGEIQLTQFQRSALVLSLDKLVKLYPELARTILFKIYSNVNESPETRSIAVLMLFRCYPSVQMLQHLAQATHDDPSDAVRSVIKSGIETISQLQGEKWRVLRERCLSVRHFLTQEQFGDQYSKTYFRDYVSHGMNLAYNHQLTHIIGREHVVPKMILFDAYENLGGFNRRVAGMQAMVSTVDELVKFLPNCNKNFCSKQTTYYRTPEQETVVPVQQQQQQGGQVFPDILKQLNIQQEFVKRLEGQFALEFLGRKGFYTFDEKFLRELPQMLVSQFSLFTDGQKWNYNKLYLRNQVVIAFPMVTGYPFIYTYRQPQLLQAIGQVQFKTVPDLAQQPTWETIQNLETLIINANVQLVHSANQIGKVGFITTFDRQRYVAGHVRKMHKYIPINLKLEINLRTWDINLKLTPIDAKKDFYFIQSGAWPFTLRKDAFDLRPAAEAQDLKIIQTRQNELHERFLGEKTTGMVFQSQFEHQFRGNHIVNFDKALWKQGLLSLASIPLSYNHLFQNMLQNQGQSLLSWLPFAFQNRFNGNYLNHVLSNLVSLPMFDEFTVNKYIKNEGLWSFLDLPFASRYRLDQSVRYGGVYTLGGFPWPLKSLDHYKYNLKYDATRSVNQIFKFSFKTSVLHNVNEVLHTVVNKVPVPVNLEEGKLAYATVFTPDNEQRRLQFLQNAAFGIKQASVAVVDAAVVFDGQNRAEYVVTIAHSQSPVDEKERLLIFLNTNKVKKTENRQMCISYLGHFPLGPVLNFEQALKYDVKANAKFQFVYGDSCQTANTNILGNINFEQSPEYKQMVRNSQVGQRCLIEMERGNKQLRNCIDATYQANLYDTINFNFDLHQMSPKISEITFELLKIVREYIAPNLRYEVANETPMTNKFVAVLKIKPIMNNEDKQYIQQTIGVDNFDIMLEYGNIRQIYTNVQIDNYLRPHLSVHRMLDINDRTLRHILNNGHICSIDQNKIFTFDNTILQHQIGKCWYVMAQYIKPQSRLEKLDMTNEFVQQRDVSILVRQGFNVNYKELMLMVRSRVGNNHVIHFIPSASGITIKIDGQDRTIVPTNTIDIFGEQQDRQIQKPLIRIWKLLGNEYQIQVRGKQMKIFYDGLSIRLHTDPIMYRYKLGGLCGGYSGERVRDLITPKQCVVNNPILFTSSWALDTTQCNVDIQKAKLMTNQMKCDRVRYTTDNILRYWGVGYHHDEFLPYQYHMGEHFYGSQEQYYPQRQQYGGRFDSKLGFGGKVGQYYDPSQTYDHVYMRQQPYGEYYRGSGEVNNMYPQGRYYGQYQYQQGPYYGQNYQTKIVKRQLQWPYLNNYQQYSSEEMYPQKQGYSFGKYPNTYQYQQQHSSEEMYPQKQGYSFGKYPNTYQYQQQHSSEEMYPQKQRYSYGKYPATYQQQQQSSEEMYPQKQGYSFGKYPNKYEYQQQHSSEELFQQKLQGYGFGKYLGKYQDQQQFSSEENYAQRKGYYYGKYPTNYQYQQQHGSEEIYPQKQGYLYGKYPAKYQQHSSEEMHPPKQGYLYGKYPAKYQQHSSEEMHPPKQGYLYGKYQQHSSEEMYPQKQGYYYEKYPTNYQYKQRSSEEMYPQQKQGYYYGKYPTKYQYQKSSEEKVHPIKDKLYLQGQYHSSQQHSSEEKDIYLRRETGPYGKYVSIKKPSQGFYGQFGKYGQQGSGEQFGNKCVVKRQMQFYEKSGQVCFTKNVVNVCPMNCVGSQLQDYEVDVYCRDVNDPVSKLWMQQIRKGETPDLTTKMVTRMMKIQVPTICVRQ